LSLLGVDVITPATLKDYEASLDAKGIPHEMKLNCVVFSTLTLTPCESINRAAVAMTLAPENLNTAQAD
jgi:hypothetical protein